MGAANNGRKKDGELLRQISFFLQRNLELDGRPSNKHLLRRHRVSPLSWIGSFRVSFGAFNFSFSDEAASRPRGERQVI
jgi:hypothetical protein